MAKHRNNGAELHQMQTQPVPSATENSNVIKSGESSKATEQKIIAVVETDDELVILREVTNPSEEGIDAAGLPPRRQGFQDENGWHDA